MNSMVMGRLKGAGHSKHPRRHQPPYTVTYQVNPNRNWNTAAEDIPGLPAK